MDFARLFGYFEIISFYQSNGQLQPDGCKLSVLLTFSYVKVSEQFFMHKNIIP